MGNKSPHPKRFFDPHEFAEALLRASLGVETHEEGGKDEGLAEWFTVCAIVVGVVYLRVRLGTRVINTLVIAGALPLLAALVRSWLFRREVACGAAVHMEACARFARRITPLLLLAFPISAALTGGWRTVLGGHSHRVDIWLGAAAYTFALLELIQLRSWEILRLRAAPDT